MKKTTAKKIRATSDLSAEVGQSTVDKLIDSVDFPFTIVEKSKSFPGCNKSSFNQINIENDALYEYKAKEIDRLFKNAVSQPDDLGFLGTKQEIRDQGDILDIVNNELLSVGGTIIEQARKALDVATNDPSNYQGPSVKELTDIIDGGVEKLTTRAGFGLYAWGKYIRVNLEKKPSIKLQSPKIVLNDIEVEAKATGELWASYKWPKCYRWCTRWKIVTKCSRIASVTMTVKVKANSHIDIHTQGAKVLAKLVIDYLALNYPVLDKLDFSSLANKGLKDKAVFVFDAGQLVATVPVIEKDFKAAQVRLPSSADSVKVEISIVKVG